MKRDFGGLSLNLAEIHSGEFHIHCSQIFLQAMLLGCARDRHNPWFLRQQPRQSPLRRCRPFASRNIADDIDQCHICFQRVRRKASNFSAEERSNQAGEAVEAVNRAKEP